MFTPSTIESCLSGLIGFRQHYNNAYDRIDADVAASSAGIYIDSSAHSLLTIENIAAIAENFNKTDVSAYSAGTTYAKGDVVKDVNIVYRSLQGSNTAHTPASSPTWWKATNLMSAYLYRLLNSASINLFNAVFSHRKLYEAVKTLLTDTSLYDGVGNLSRKVTKLSRFVGFRINPQYPDTVISIPSMGFQFDTVNPALDIYVYHSSQSDYLKKITVNVATAINFTWKELSETISLKFNSTSYNDGGSFYIGYYEDDLVGQAIWKDQAFGGPACQSCNGLNQYLYNQWSKFFSVQPVYVEEAWLDVDKKMFNEEKVVEISNTNWGLNMKMQVTCDVSDLVCRNKMAFADALRKQVVHDLLSDMAYSMRDNQKKEKVSQMAMYALENKENYTKGVMKELEEAVKNVSFDISTMSSVCLPCNNGGHGVSISSMYN